MALTIREAGDKIDASEQVVRIYCRKGLIPGAFKFGRDWMIPEDALIGFKRPKIGGSRKAGAK